MRQEYHILALMEPYSGKTADRTPHPRGYRRLALLLPLLLLPLALLLYPEPLYSHHLQSGRLHLYSDRPFQPAPARAVLAEVELRLARSPLQDPSSTYRIFVANSPWRLRLAFLWNYGAGGVNYYPIAHNVFLRQADIDSNRLLRSDGAPVPPPRTLSYYAAHEIAHTLIGKHTGAIGNWRLPVWIREGLADYIGFNGEVDIPALTQALRDGHPSMDPIRSGLYARYRLLVAYMLTREHWSATRLLQSNLPITAAEQLLLAPAPR